MPSPVQYDVLNSQAMKLCGPFYSIKRQDRFVPQKAKYKDRTDESLSFSEQNEPKLRLFKNFPKDSRGLDIIIKTYDPGPGSYNFKSSVGAMPAYIKKAIRKIKIPPSNINDDTY